MVSGTRWSVGQVLALAPDAASVRAARGLASPRRWSQLGSTESLVWGRCQGSSREPYQVSVDLGEPAFRCTCPSRKLPCKHGLALLLLWAEGDGSVAQDSDAADFAATWADERAARAARDASPRTEPADPEAQARRLADRLALMSAGLDDLERWLFDLVRQGLTTARTQPYRYWDDAAARLVDAQVPGLAERVREMGGAVHARSDWADHLLAEAGRWFLAVRAWRRRVSLPDPVAGDLRTLLGWAWRQDDVLAGERVHDRWEVLGLRGDDDGGVRAQRTWLRGAGTGQVVVLLDFAAAGGALQVAHVVGSVVEGEVALYPGAPPRRAVLAADRRVVGSTDRLAGGLDVDGALDQMASWLAGNPWADRLPVVLAGVVPVVDGGGAWLVDGAARRLPLADASDRWALLALSAGRPVDVAAEWEDGALHPMTVAVDKWLHVVAPVPTAGRP